RLATTGRAATVDTPRPGGEFTTMPFDRRGPRPRARRLGTLRLPGSRTPRTGRDRLTPSVAAHNALHHALDLTELHANRIELRVRGLKPDVVGLLEETLERRRAIGQERDDPIAVVGDGGALDQHVVTVENPLVAHRVAL